MTQWPCQLCDAILDWEDAAVKRFRIHIADPDDQDLALVEVMKRGRITCLHDDEFIVPEPALDLLTELGVKFDVLRQEEPEKTRGPVRDPAATHGITTAQTWSVRSSAKPASTC